MTCEWRYREHLGPMDSMAPHVGGYWITEVDDFMARVWRDGETDAVHFDIHDGPPEPLKTPENCGTDVSIEAAKLYCESSLEAYAR